MMDHMMGQMMGQVMPMSNGMGWGIFVLLFLALVAYGLIVGAVAGLLLRSSPPGAASSGTSALDIAHDRYARGELTQNEFEQMRETLKERNTTVAHAA
jgi:putative membrane protein